MHAHMRTLRTLTEPPWCDMSWTGTDVDGIANASDCICNAEIVVFFRCTIQRSHSQQQGTLTHETSSPLQLPRVGDLEVVVPRPITCDFATKLARPNQVMTTGLT